MLRLRLAVLSAIHALLCCAVVIQFLKANLDGGTTAQH